MVARIHYACAGGRHSRRHPRQRYKYDLDYRAINAAALARLPELLARWLPNGRLEGHEYVALNPKRDDYSLGSFKINLKTGKWSDFATGDAGGDVVSLAAYLAGTSQAEAARSLAEMLGVDDG
jgi:hypothetical protein